ncbi:MAG: hypothetical protein HDQ96_06680 [Lachnospiraceae bacterium]|nr:hypothetical protein [Lachnospiraceae bacterium]
MGLGIDAYSQSYTGAVGTASYANTQASTGETKSEKAAAESGATVEFSEEGKKALEESQETTDKVVKTETATSKISSKINKMSDTERSNLVARLQSDQEARHNQLMNMVQKLFSNQANTYAQSSDMWKFLASGKFTVDAATKAQAQADIAEDGYYGVKKTSERMFEFAMALTGGDVDKMKEMQSAVEKGYKQAEKTWGGNLPDISKQTLDATNQLFEDYYKEQESASQKVNPIDNLT